MQSFRIIIALALLGSPSGCGAGPTRSSQTGAGDVLSDELSMPREPTVSLESFASARECGVCHRTHYAEWSTSSHAYAMIDPVYRALVALRQEHYGGKQDKFCLQCHSPIGTRGGDIVPGFEFADLEPITLEGVTCETCHKVASLARPYNSGHVLDPDGPARGPIPDPTPSPFHGSELSPLHETSDFCAGCHDVREVSGLVLERTFAEWVESPAAAAGQNWQTCHMSTYTGPAVVGGPTRTLHRHAWIGVDLPLAEGFVTPEQEEELRAGVKALLEGAASVSLEAASSIGAGDPLDLFITVRNNISAHNFPTGSTFNRQAWVEVVVRDGDGELVFATGTLDDSGEIRGPLSRSGSGAGPDPILLSSIFVDDEGAQVLFPWRAAGHRSNSIPPQRDRTFALRVPTSGAVRGPLSVEARLLFRALAPHMLRALGLDEYVTRLELHELSRASASVELDAP